MMAKLSHLLLPCIAFLLTTPLLAQDDPRRCTDEYGKERCTAAAQADQRKFYGVPPIEDLVKGEAKKGEAPATGMAIRAFFVDGYGQDAGMVAFIRAPDSEPRVESRLGGENETILTAPVTGRVWADMLRAGATFDRELVPLPKRNDEIAFCLHSWLTTVEMIGRDGKVRRGTSRACGPDGLASAYGNLLAAAAVQAIPACAALDPRQSRNDVTRLRDCAMLSGDRAAAADAYAQFHAPWFQHPNGPEFARAIQYLFFDRAEVRWPGAAPVTGNAAAAQSWAGRARDLPFYPRRFHGETADRVRIEGVLLPRPANDADRPKPISATMVWTRENGFDFRLRSMTAADKVE